MLNNYLKITLRNLLHNKVHSFVSIFGLALGLTATTIILIVNYSELTWDKNWKDADRIYELEQIYTARTTPTKVDTLVTLGLMRKVSGKFSDIEHLGHISYTEGDIKLEDSKTHSIKSFNENVSSITPNIIDIFSLTAIRGGTEEFYRNKQSVIISEGMANKLFFKADPIGKIIKIHWKSFSKADENPNINTNYKIIAVIANSPKRSSLQRSMDILVNERYSDEPDDPNIFRYRSSSSTYVKLKVDVRSDTIDRQFPNFLNTDIPGLGGGEKKSSDVFQFRLTKVQDIHLYGANSSNSTQRIFILYSLAALIAILACVNYINLATARFSRRQKEISLRKTLGATRLHIIVQFLIEALASVGCALLLTCIILEPILPWLNAQLAPNIELNYFSDFSLLSIIFGTALCLGLTSGLYPGLILSNIKPAVILKANKSHETPSSIRLRNLLVIFQFVISTTMLASVGLIATQLYTVLHTDPGYDTKNIVFLIDDKLVADKGTINALKQKIQSIPGVLAATKTIPMLPGGMSELKKTYSAKQKPEEALPIPLTFIDEADEITLLNISLIAGKNFALKSEDGNKPNVIINEQALKTFGFSSAEEAIGMTLNINFYSSENTLATIIGVTSKLQLGDLNKQSGPQILMRLRDGWILEFGTLGVRFAENVNRTALIAQIKEVCKSFIGTATLREVWLQSLVEEEYKNQILIAKFAYTFAALAIFISCLGLYGLAAFAAEKRTKEIGLRKVHGASITDIVRLLLWQFTRPIALANLIAWPIALYAINHWLETFSQRIDLWIWGPIYCLTAGVLAILIAWLTVGGQAYWVACAMPVNALREA
jgi:putative ABC transport system permease protein